MDDTDSQPPICPCGFWGSRQTLNLCSKCYKDELKRTGKLEAKNQAAINIADNRIPSECGDNPTTSKCDNNPEANSKNLKVKSDSGLAAQNDIFNLTVETQDLNSSSIATGNNQDNLPDRPVQRNRKRCWMCKARLELAQRELGNCKCSYVFCQLHRLPEQHSCVFDHKESGRREAREKMVGPGPRKVGRSFQRMDE